MGEDGQPIWFLPLSDGRRATDFRTQTYAGQPVLTWWEGIATGGRGAGEGIIADASYRVIARVRAGNGVRMDLHEFTLTPRGTALVMAYHDRARDLRAWGGSKRGRVTDGVVQEIDVATGRVLFQWNAMGSVPLSDSYRRITRGRTPWDAFHLNSVDEEPDGDLLVSSTPHEHGLRDRPRHRPDPVADRRQAVELRDGRGDALRPPARRAGAGRRHDPHLRQRPAREAPPLPRAVDPPRPPGRARRRSSAPCSTRCRSSRAPRATRSRSRTGTRFFGWGSQGRISELSPGGGLLLDLRLPHGFDTYRAYRQPWVGRPATVAGDRRGDAPRRRHDGLRELERRHGGRCVAGPHGRLRGDPAGRRDRSATRVRDADPPPAPGPVGAGPRARCHRRGAGAVARRLFLAPPGKIPTGEQYAGYRMGES